MGDRGPVPQRSDRRRRYDPRPTDKVTPARPVVTAPRAKSSWHPIARHWYESLKDSAQSRYYEPSDWSRAQYIAELMTRSLNSAKVPAGLVATIMSGMSELLDTEASRRRVRMEIQRPAIEEETPDPADIDEARRRLRACE